MPLFLGVDPSLRSTGATALRVDTTTSTLIIVDTARLESKDTMRLEPLRVWDLRNLLLDFVSKLPEKIDNSAIEGPSLGSTHRADVLGGSWGFLYSTL